MLADNGVNIATFPPGRSGPGDDAIALLQVDDVVPETVVDQLENLNNILQVKALGFNASSCVCGPLLPFYSLSPPGEV